MLVAAPSQWRRLNTTEYCNRQDGVGMPERRCAALCQHDVLCADQLTVPPIAGASLGMGHGNAINSILVMPEDNLKRELVDAARAVSSVDPNEPFRVGFNVRQRDVDGNAEVTRGGRTALGIPIRGCVQLGRRVGMKTNSHHQHRASRITGRGHPPNPR